MSKPYIKFLDIYCGAFCNLACDHCDARSHVIQTTEFDPSLEEILDGIRLVKEKFDVVYYGTSGGEPLLYLDKIKKIFQFIRTLDTNATLMFSTNGTLINKKLDELVELITSLNVNLFVCNHFSGFDNPLLSNKVKKNTQLLVNRLEMVEGNTVHFYKNLFDLENKQNDLYFQKWINERTDQFDNADPSEKVYYKNNMFVNYREQSYFKKNYQLIENIPKPFKTNDPVLSYRNGCSSDMCSFLIDKKLYKCATLGTLKRFLNFYNLTNDPDWKKYISYEPLDLENCTVNEIDFFHKTKYCSINECDMCPSSNVEYKKTADKVLKKHRN